MASPVNILARAAATSVFVAFLTAKALPKEFWVAASQGDNANDGSQSFPLRTIQSAADRMEPGDTCWITKGTYRETLIPKSGNPDRPMSFSAVPGEAVFIVGTERSESLQREGEVWRTRLPEGFRSQVFLDGKPLPLAHWPNQNSYPWETDWAVAGPGSSGGRVICPNLPSVKPGRAFVKVLPGHGWVAWTRPVTKGLSGEIQFDPSFVQGDLYRVQQGTPFYLFGDRCLMDRPGEWVAEGNSLYLQPATQAKFPQLLELKTRDLGVQLTGKCYVNVSGVHFFACSAELSKAENCKLTDCHFKYASHFVECEGYAPKSASVNGIALGGKNNVMERCSVDWSGGNGVTLTGQGNCIINCLITNSNYLSINDACVTAQGIGHQLLQSTLKHSGRFILSHSQLKKGVISRNEMCQAGLSTKDCGITYAWQSDGDNTEISNNWVHDNWTEFGCGIYLDNGSRNYRVLNNVVWSNQSTGIRLNTPSLNNLIQNNTLFHNGASMDSWSPDNNRDFSGSVIVNNIIPGGFLLGMRAIYVNNCEARDPELVNPAGWRPPLPEVALAAPYLNNASLKPLRDSLRATWDFRPRPGSPAKGAGRPYGEIRDNEDVGAKTIKPNPGHLWGDPPDFSGCFSY